MSTTFTHPVYDIPVIMPNGEAVMILDGELEGEIDISRSGHWAPYDLDIGNFELTGGRIEVLNDAEEVIAIQLWKGHPILAAIADSDAERITESGIETYSGLKG